VADDAGLDLAGYANDDAGTPLSGRSLRWLDGRRLLGTGGELTVTGLAPGRHTIILEARDRLGRRAVQRVSVAVTAAAPRLIVFSAPARLGPHSRSVRLRLASLVPALARIGRVRRAISSRPVTLVVPVRPGHGRIVLLLTLSSYGKRTRIPVVIVR
jgi:hypothetical protein